MDNYIYVLFFSELILITVSYTITRGNMLSPSFVSYVMFSIATLCVIYNVEFWNVEFTWKAYCIMMLGFFSMMIAEVLTLRFVGHQKVKRNQVFMIEKKEYYVHKPIAVFIATMSIIMTVLYACSVLKQGASLGGIGLNAIGYLKYNGDRDVLGKIAYRVSMIFFYVYVYVVAYNIIKAKSKIKTQLLNIIPIICFFVVTFFNGNRMGFLKCLSALYVISLVFIYQNSAFVKKDVHKILKYTIMGGVLFTISFYFMRIMTKVNTTTAERTLIDYITYYIGSPVCLFSKYLDNPIVVHQKNTLFGETTLSSVLQELGFQPIYENNMLYVGGDSMFAGNAMTWFQQPYNDYGLVGMCIFTFIIYFIFDLIVYKWVLKNNSPSGIITLMFFYFVIITSFYYCQTMFAIALTNIIYIIAILFVLKNLRRLKL